MAKEIVLVDMDGVLFDWATGFYRIANEMADERGVPLGLPQPQDLTTFYFHEMVQPGDEHTLDIVNAAMCDPRLYAELEPIEGAAQALGEMAELHEVRICSTPEKDNPACAGAKYAAMTEHFGKDWAKRVILTHDKTMVHGRLLIDDKPQIKGLLSPRQSWQQVAFAQPYNVDFPGPRLERWADWREVVEPLLGRDPHAAQVA